MVCTGKQLSKKVLEANGFPMTGEEIWKYKLEHGLDTSVGGKTPWRTLQAQIYMDIKEKGENSDFYQDSKRPVRFFLSKRSNKVPSAEGEPQEKKIIKNHPNKINRIEIKMHPFLVYFLSTDSHFRCHSLTINASKAPKGNQGANIWRYPDIVGVHYPFDDDYDPEVRSLFARLEQNLIKLFSFELKFELNVGNLRESFFQAISNSTWANEGYLVASTIPDDVRDELRSLSRSFGIGVIHLDMENPAQSEIIFPSGYKEYIDGDAVNILSDNTDFKRFITQVNKDSVYGGVHKDEYDKVLSEEELSEHYFKLVSAGELHPDISRCSLDNK